MIAETPVLPFTLAFGFLETFFVSYSNIDFRFLTYLEKMGNLVDQMSRNSLEGGCGACSQLSQLEIEAFTAIREVSAFVKSICLSEVLSRTPDLIFLNVTTLEGHTYCVELTIRGWRVCSDREDSMNGDFRKLDLHSRYFETIYQLLDVISPMYRDKFGQALTNKLNRLTDESKTNGSNQ
uniref:GSKIP domain-containing protein n=1 Tax=Panagrolaimus sp. JU765 TaxID=591449 RepID=A0AC34R4K1_9BILA